MNRFSFLLAAVTLSIASAANAQTASVSVDARTSVFSSAFDLDGSVDNTSLPSVVVALNPGVNRVLTLPTVTGTIDPAHSPHGADGGFYDGNGVNVDGLGPISGIKDTNNRTLALLAVFTVGSPTPNGPAPGTLDFSGNHDFLTLSPLLNQTFFVGDGRTAANVLQQFHVPNGATHVQFGFADAFATSNTPFVGGASAYQDNHGSLSVTYNIAAESTSAVPEPGSLALFLPALAGLSIVARRRKRSEG